MRLITILLLPSLVFAQEAAAPPPPGNFFVTTFMYFVLAVLGYYMLVQRPEQKKELDQAKFMEGLKKGTQVITEGGIIGTVSSINDDSVSLEIAPKIKIKVSSRHISAYEPKK